MEQSKEWRSPLPYTLVYKLFKNEPTGHLDYGRQLYFYLLSSIFTKTHIANVVNIINKDEDNSPNRLNDKNPASSHKFRQKILYDLSFFFPLICFGRRCVEPVEISVHHCHISDGCQGEHFRLGY